MINVEIYSKVIGEGKTILYLHGWGRSSEDYQKIIDLLPNYRHVLIDFPGCGKSGEPSSGLSIYDNQKILDSFLISHNIKVDLIIGHSYGGKVGFLYSLNHNDIPLILSSPSLVKPRFSIKKHFKIKIYKLKKFLFNHNLISALPNSGSEDYKKSSGVMKDTLVKAVNTYYDKKLKNFNGKIVLFWGKNDQVTPLYQGKRIKRIAKNCELIINNGDHYSHLEYLYAFTKIIEREMELI